MPRRRLRRDTSLFRAHVLGRSLPSFLLLHDPSQVTDRFIKNVDVVVATKEKDIMKV